MQQMGNEKIIIVEDDLFLQSMYRDAFKYAGYNVLTASDGEEALNLIKNNLDVNLILLDLMIPKINGIDVLKEIKKDQTTNKLSVIVLTNLNEDSVVQDALKLGAKAFLIKVEYTPQQIVETVKQYIDLRVHLKTQE